MGKYRGEVVYLYAYDIANEFGKPVQQVLGFPVERFAVDAHRRNPKQLFFEPPWMVRLPAQDRQGPRGNLKVHRTIKILDVGAISIAVRVPVEVDRIEDLIIYHDLEFSDGSLTAEVRELAERIRGELVPHCVRPVAKLADDEAYTVFCMENAPLVSETLNFSATNWLETRRREIAALLTQEGNPGFLSAQESEETTSRFLSYYESDLIVADWDAALVIDEPRNFEDIVYVMEMANLQLAELETYDRLLDASLDRAYADLRGQSRRNRREILREFRELRVDLSRFNDQLSNTTKFFGDWHLARVYHALADRFHLAEWHRVLNEKLKTLDDQYQLLQQDQLNRWMLVLELMIVLMFVVDIIILLVELFKEPLMTFYRGG